jgi:precorrin-6B methylase 2
MDNIPPFTASIDHIAGLEPHDDTRHPITAAVDHTATGRVDVPLLAAALRAHHNRLRDDMATMDSLLDRLTVSPRGVTDLVSEVSMMTIPRWHFAMLNDRERCDAYSVALERRVRPGMHVLDIGTGGGLLALMAARAGAGRVTTCESNPLVAELARRIIHAAGMDSVVTVVDRPSYTLEVGRDLAGPADLIVSEIVDGGLIGEGLLPTIRHARARLLAPGGDLLPRRCRIVGVAVESEVLASLNQVGFASGFDMGLFNVAATTRHFPINLWTRPHRALSPPTELVSFDLVAGSLDDGSADVPVSVLADGQAHGLAVWFELDLGGGVVIRNSPDNHSSHWTQAFVPFPRPVPMTTATAVTARLSWHGTRLSAHLSARSPR